MQTFHHIDKSADWIIEQLDKKLVIGAPLGLGKPNQLLNALYERAKQDSSISLTLLTALSLEVPTTRSYYGSALLDPITKRLYGEDYPDLLYLKDRRRQAIPDNIQIIEFFLAPGQWLSNPQAQQHYLSSNYTHVVRDLLDRGVNCIVQMVSAKKDSSVSLSCNPDLTLDVVPAMRAQTKRCLMVGQVNTQLPYLYGDAEVSTEFFDAMLEAPELNTPLFSLPKTKVSVQDYCIGLHASHLVKDGGTIQIGIGSLGDALAYALCLRQNHNYAYNALLADVKINHALGGLDPLKTGLYAATEMLVDALVPLIEHGIVKREVRDYDDGEPHLVHAGFYLGCNDFYAWLRKQRQSSLKKINMTRVARINQLYGSEALDRTQRKDARFVNSCLKVTLTGAVVSDGLAEQNVLSGVGGQYNFVAMAHALEDGRSIMQVRSTRTNKKGVISSNICFEYPHTTIPRHLRDLVVSEYGVADLRGKTDSECIAAMLNIADSRFQSKLLEQAKRAHKIASDYEIPEAFKHNTPAALIQKLAPYRAQGLFLDYPFGTDLSSEEQQLADILQTIQQESRTLLGKLRLMKRSFGKPNQQSVLLRQRLGLASPSGLKDRRMASLIHHYAKGRPS